MHSPATLSAGRTCYWPVPFCLPFLLLVTRPAGHLPRWPTLLLITLPAGNHPPLAAATAAPTPPPPSAPSRVYSTSKPPWCQPWTITLTGSVAIGGAWLLFPSFPGAILAVGTTAGVSLWWWVFLIAYPQATLRYAAADERRAGRAAGDDRR